MNLEHQIIHGQGIIYVDSDSDQTAFDLKHKASTTSTMTSRIAPIAVATGDDQKSLESLSGIIIASISALLPLLMMIMMMLTTTAAAAVATTTTETE